MFDVVTALEVPLRFIEKAMGKYAGEQSLTLGLSLPAAARKAVPVVAQGIDRGENPGG